MVNLSQILASIRWQDIVDIGLNSYILFRLYVLFRGTTVFRILIGMAVLWFFQGIAISVGLIVTSWVFRGITAVAALIIIVVFRNEIRNVLQARNFRSLFWGLPKKPIATPIETIVEGVFELAQNRIGALIVFPGKDNLDDFVQKGIPWRGAITKEMIMSVFWPDNPVHDGAAVIQGNRILEVGCILPLSQRSDLPSHYGTRHRAALGLSENTDAMVIVVSEERGNVAVTKGSRIRTLTGKAQLEQRLREHTGVAANEGGRGTREKLEISAAAIVSISLISAVWLSVSRGLDTLMTVEVPIEYMNREPAKEIVDTSVGKVSLKLAGSASLLKTVQPEQARVRIDLSKSIVGLNSFTVSQDNIRLPPGVVLKGVNPPVIEVTLDVLSHKILP
ncbi:MAG: diadenylate cyclase CdaA, partial [Desulfobacterales bacterium]